MNFDDPAEQLGTISIGVGLRESSHARFFWLTREGRKQFQIET